MIRGQETISVKVPKHIQALYRALVAPKYIFCNIFRKIVCECVRAFVCACMCACVFVCVGACSGLVYPALGIHFDQLRMSQNANERRK